MDLHSALKTQKIKERETDKIHFLLVGLQNGKDDITYTLHIYPKTKLLSPGFDVSDFLEKLGFINSECSFMSSKECYVKQVDKNFDFDNFANEFNVTYNLISNSETKLTKCGFYFDKSENSDFMRNYNNIHKCYSDCHKVIEKKDCKQDNDDFFEYKLTYIKTENDRGWVTHYKIKNEKYLSEIESVFDFLKIKKFNECPEYNFESCYYRYIKNIVGEYEFNPEYSITVYNQFNEHKNNFYDGIQDLLEANKKMERFGFSFLSLEGGKIQYKTKEVDEIIKKVQPETSQDKQLCDICNAIENLLKGNDGFKKINSPSNINDILSDDKIKEFRRKIQCFRHCSEEALEERKQYNNKEKEILILEGKKLLTGITKFKCK